VSIICPVTILNPLKHKDYPLKTLSFCFFKKAQMSQRGMGQKSVTYYLNDLLKVPTEESLQARRRSFQRHRNVSKGDVQIHIDGDDHVRTFLV